MKFGYKVLLGIAVAIIVLISIFTVFRGGVEEGIAIPTGALVFDDFDDGGLGTNLDTSVGTMGGYPPDPRYPGDQQISFVKVGEGYAIKMNVDVPQGGWSGYWAFLRKGDLSQDPILVSIGSGYDLSGYSKLKMAVRASKNMTIKLELQDTLQFSNSQNAKTVFTGSRDELVMQKYGKSIENLSMELFGLPPEEIGRKRNAEGHEATMSHNGIVRRTVKTEWDVIEVDLSEFLGQASGLNLRDIRQLNIVFETPIRAILWIDWIVFE